MKIGIFTEVYEPYISGVVTSIKMLVETLKSMNHEVYIVTANLTKCKFKYDETNKIIYLPGIKTGIYNTRLTRSHSKKAMKIIKNWNLDVIHSHTEFGVGAFSRHVSQKLNIPVIHTYHTLYEDYVHYVTKGHFNNLGKKIAIQITKRYCDKLCDELIVPTPKIKELFNQKYNITRNINVIPTGIDTKKFELSPKIKKDLPKLKKKYHIKDTDFVIGSVGRMAIEKSYDKIIEIMPDLLKEIPNAKLLLVGYGPELENLKKLAHQLKLDKHVCFTDKVEYDLIPSYYHLFDVMTSFSVTETQGLTIIEGLASSLPVVCINDDSFKEMITNQYNGYLFKDSKEFIKIIKELYNDPKLYQKISQNAKNSIHKYSKEVFAEDILKVYFKALETKPKV